MQNNDEVRGMGENIEEVRGNKGIWWVNEG